MRFIRFIKENFLFVAVLFLLFFIPLYPKLPLVDIKNTWVYVRVEDFLVLFVLAMWVFLLVKKKISLRTPLTIPIMVYWIVGAVATIHGVMLIFPTIAGVFPNLALLSFLRRIEYMSIFFVAYSSVKEKRFLKYTTIVLLVTLLIVIFYGFGQKYLGFPAFLTMNEEFAKGEAIQLSSLSRVPSTFAGHYDLAAFLVLVLPILSSLFFGTKKIVTKGILAVSVFLGIILLFMTVSRVSFVVLFVSLAIILLFQKRKLAIFLIAFLAVVSPFLIMRFTPALVARFGNTVKEVNVLVDAKTGNVIGQASIVSKDHFDNKLVIQRDFHTANAVVGDAKIEETELQKPDPDTFLPRDHIPRNATLVVPPNAPTGENLPQGTAYINLSLSPVVKRLGEFFYENPAENAATASAVSFIFHGNFLVKRASAYDLSFTTRFQGEWPHALLAFSRNIFFGSGYSSISLAVDNDYLRLLGETGLLGFVSFLVIFLTIAIVIKKTYHSIDSDGVRSFVVGFAVGVFGLLLNAFLIDVFEASKVAFVLWILAGITLGTLTLYKEKPMHLYRDLLSALSSTTAILVYLFVLTVVLYLPMLQNYFVADDYTWLRWAAQCGVNNPVMSWCSSPVATIVHYFTSADGFFYRPGTKTFFYLMYPFFWLNQNIYHIVSLVIEFGVSVCVYFLVRKVFQTKLQAAITAFLFLIMSGYMEIVVWISATGHLFSGLFALISVLLYIYWAEKRKVVLYLLSIMSFIFSLFFYEAGLVTPLFILLYQWYKEDKFSFKRQLRIWQYDFFAVPIVIYTMARFFSNSHWSGGDYSYNLVKLPFNFLGNILGYVMLTYIGPLSLSPYEKLRDVFKSNIPVAILGALLVGMVAFSIYRFVLLPLSQRDKKVIVFGSLFFIISLLPFLGFGNIAPRYSYVGTIGLLILFVFFLQKMYTFLLSSGRDIALCSIAVIILSFSLLHLIQEQQIHQDWHTAGQKAQQFFVSIDSLYSDYWSKDSMKFHFINVPVRENQAWVFPPAALPDALWFVFQNPNIQIQTWSSPEAVFSQIHSASTHEKVFSFTGSGDVVEYTSLQDAK